MFFIPNITSSMRERIAGVLREWAPLKGNTVSVAADVANTLSGRSTCALITLLHNADTTNCYMHPSIVGAARASRHAR
jgi:hypothetical protein